jgi:hypothetical protein
MASLTLNRHLHRATVINTRGDSYRTEEPHEAAALQPYLGPNQT